MQTQVVHQNRPTIAWAPILVICLLAIASVFAIELATREKGTPVTAPAISSVDRGADVQKAGMSEGGVRNVSGTVLREGGAAGIATIGRHPAVGGPHPRVKFGAQSVEGPRDAALQATITRIQHAR